MAGAGLAGFMEEPGAAPQQKVRKAPRHEELPEQEEPKEAVEGLQEEWRRSPAVHGHGGWSGGSSLLTPRSATRRSLVSQERRQKRMLEWKGWGNEEAEEPLKEGKVPAWGWVGQALTWNTAGALLAGGQQEAGLRQAVMCGVFPPPVSGP